MLIIVIEISKFISIMIGLMFQLQKMEVFCKIIYILLNSLCVLLQKKILHVPKWNATLFIDVHMDKSLTGYKSCNSITYEKCRNIIVSKNF